MAFYEIAMIESIATLLLNITKVKMLDDLFIKIPRKLFGSIYLPKYILPL